MGEVSRRSGRPVSFGLTTVDRRPDLYRRVIEFAKEENASGACVRPQTTARGIGILFGLESRTPFDGAPAWQELRAADQRPQDAAAPRRRVPAAPDRRRPTSTAPRSTSTSCSCCRPTARRATTAAPDDSLAAHAERARRQPGRGVHRAAARDRRRAQLQHAVPQPGPRRGRGDARRSARHARPRRRRRPRRPDHGRQPADVPAHATGCGSASAGRSRRRSAGSPPTPPTCSASSVGAGCASARSPTSTSSTSTRSTLHQPEYVHDLPGRRRPVRAARRRLRVHARQRRGVHGARRAHRRVRRSAAAQRRLTRSSVTRSKNATSPSTSPSATGSAPHRRRLPRRRRSARVRRPNRCRPARLRMRRARSRRC